MDSYIKHGYLADVYEPYMYEGSEWGEALRGLWTAYDRQEVWDEFELNQMEILLRRKLHLAYEEGWLKDRYPDYFAQAQENFAHVRDYWRGRAMNFKALDTFEIVDAGLPAWIKGSEVVTINE